MKKLFILAFIFTFFTKNTFQSQIIDKSWKNIINNKEDAWFASKEAKEIAENVLLYQRNIGGWPKNIQMHQPVSKEKKAKLVQLKKSSRNATTDNGATYQEMLFLSKINQFQPDIKYKKAFLKGLDYLLKAQYDNGGWPQF